MIFTENGLFVVANKTEVIEWGVPDLRAEIAKLDVEIANHHAAIASCSERKAEMETAIALLKQKYSELANG